LSTGIPTELGRGIICGDLIITDRVRICQRKRRAGDRIVVVVLSV